MNVVVVGAGKMGLPLACHYASRGARVLVCDTDGARVEQIHRGECPIDEPGVPELLAAAVRDGRLRATTDTPAAVAQSEAVVVIVPALLTRERQADLAAIESASRRISKGLRKGTLVSYETTVPVGATRNRLLPILEENGLAAGRDFFLCFSPERIKSRTVLANLDHTPKIVGGVDAQSALRAADFYTRFLGAPVVVLSSLEAAEFAKLAGMLYRDVNIALANELSRYGEAAGIDFAEVLAAANTDPETSLLAPGIGVGGHCTPVYPYFLLPDARARGVPATLAERAREINDAQAAHAVGRLKRAMGTLANRRVLILGLAFRPGVKEHACSTAFLLAQALGRENADISLHDPLYSAGELRRLGFTPGSPDDGPAAEALILNTAHPSYRSLDLDALAHKGLKTVVDGRRLWPPEHVRRLGLVYLGVGFPDEGKPPAA